MKKTWPEIWLEIAEAYWTLARNRTARQKELTPSGLCWAVELASEYGGYDDRDGYSMIPRLRDGHDKNSFWYTNRRRKSDIRRAQFAEHMAGIPHDDFEEFIK